MTPPYSVHTAPADTTHAKASAAKRLRSNAHVAINFPIVGLWEVKLTPESRNTFSV